MTNLHKTRVTKLIEEHRKTVKNYDEEIKFKLDEERKEKEEELQLKLERRRTHVIRKTAKEVKKLNPDL